MGMGKWLHFYEFNPKKSAMTQDHRSPDARFSCLGHQDHDHDHRSPDV